MPEYTVDEWFEKCRQQCDVREVIPALIVAVSFPNGQGVPRFHLVFPEKVAIEEGIAALEQALKHLKRVHVERN